MRKIALLLVILLLSSGPLLRAQTRIETATTNGGGKGGAAVSYRYLFENDRFTTPRQEITFGADGRGQFRFTRKNQEEIVNQLELSPELVAQIQALFDALNFLDSTEHYQHKKDFSHLGRITITYARDGRERSVSFNHTANQVMNRLVELFRNIATQETRVFEIETVRATDPISTPAQLRWLENELRSKHIAEPRRLIPLLQNIRLDEGVPLIARNHAERLLEYIKKGK